jgi:hypothetical protein
MTDSARPQDAGRQHRRKGAPSAATASLLARYHEAMRGDLGDILRELEPAPAEDAGLGLDGAPLIKRPPVKDRAALWDLAIKLGRELGTEIDPGPVADVTAAPRSRRRRADFGGA